MATPHNRSQMAMAGAGPFAIMKAMGHTDIKTTMIYVSLGKSHIRDQVEVPTTISVPTSAYQAQTRSQSNSGTATPASELNS